MTIIYPHYQLYSVLHKIFQPSLTIIQRVTQKFATFTNKDKKRERNSSSAKFLHPTGLL
jgi:hypothetical protein